MKGNVAGAEFGRCHRVFSFVPPGLDSERRFILFEVVHLGIDGQTFCLLSRSDR